MLYNHKDITRLKPAFPVIPAKSNRPGRSIADCIHARAALEI
jgi:hypothetical protein